MVMKGDCHQLSDNGEPTAIVDFYMDTHLNLNLNLVRVNWMKEIGLLILEDLKI